MGLSFLNTMECTYVYVYFALTPLELFRANETNYKTKLNRLRTLTSRQQTCWLCTSIADELNQGLPGTHTSMLLVRAGLNSGSPNRLAALPPSK